jgi:hypothetical protein
LKNTEVVFGIVVYAGLDTKIFRNLKTVGVKFSSMERLINLLVLWVMLLNLIILLISASLAVLWESRNAGWYLPPGSDGAAVRKRCLFNVDFWDSDCRLFHFVFLHGTFVSLCFHRTCTIGARKVHGVG